MEIKILELSKDRARIVFVGEGHTFMNLLTDEVLRDPAVDVARYTMEFQHSDPDAGSFRMRAYRRTIDIRQQSRSYLK